MKIKDSSIQMSSQHSLIKTYQKREDLKAWENSGAKMPAKLKEIAKSLSGDKLELSDEAQNFAENKGELDNSLEEILNTTNINDISLTDGELKSEDHLKIQVLEDFLYALLHKKIKLQVPKELKLQTPENIKLNSLHVIHNSNTASNSNSKLGWGFQYNFNESYSESEKMSFKSSGLIHTADGKEVNFDINLNMSRSFYTEKNLSIQAGDKPIDPLVINFDGNAAEITSTKFSFDLDSDGKEDQISSLKEGSGFLALDLNQDGIINDGKELFGTNSGDGFKDLAQYDTDHNNWIDENDEIFNKLKIWTKDKDGNNQLFALGEKGIGAIYLGNIDTQFSMKNTENRSEAEVKSSGIFVKENGAVGTIQHIDFIA